MGEQEPCAGFLAALFAGPEFRSVDQLVGVAGKRISDFEAWPAGGAKPALHTLSVLAQLYGTQPHRLVDFADYGAERAAFRAHDHPTAGWGPTVPTAAIPSTTADIASGCAAYVKCCQAIVEGGTYYRDEIDELLAVLNRVVATLVCQDAAWLDVVVPVHTDAKAGAVPLVEGLESEHGWLQVWASGIRRTTRPSLIPIQVSGTPWRGSGNAYLSQGIDYVGSFRGLYTAAE